MPHNLLPNDSLLKTGRLFTSFLMGLLAIGFAALIIGIPVLFLFQGEIADAMHKDAAEHLPAVLAAFTGLMVWAAVLFASSYVFLLLLRRIIDTVGKGDPFTPENATRLTQMGWLALFVQLGTLPMIQLIAYLVTRFPPENLDLDISFSLSGILLALVLFILARVFQHGSQMRDDLEGTV